MIEDFNVRMDEWREQIDAELRKIVSETEYPNEFKRILEYALFPGGKRLRPVLLLEWHDLYGVPTEYALRYACGIEILHSYSLIHDDMPCMDNDDMRRGKPSVHKQFGEGKALLAGDALMDLAYKILMTPRPDGDMSPFIPLCDACGDLGIIRGQFEDLYGEITTLDELLKMYRFKTGALIMLSCISGFVLGNNISLSGVSAAKTPGGELGGDGKMIDYIMATAFSEAFGCAFQLYDDISEYINGEKCDSTNVLDFLDLDEAKKLLNEQLNSATKSLSALGARDTAHLRRLVDKFVIM